MKRVVVLAALLAVVVLAIAPSAARGGTNDTGEGGCDPESNVSGDGCTPPSTSPPPPPPPPEKHHHNDHNNGNNNNNNNDHNNGNNNNNNNKNNNNNHNNHRDHDFTPDIDFEVDRDVDIHVNEVLPPPVVPAAPAEEVVRPATPLTRAPQVSADLNGDTAATVPEQTAVRTAARTLGEGVPIVQAPAAVAEVSGVPAASAAVAVQRVQEAGLAGADLAPAKPAAATRLPDTGGVPLVPIVLAMTLFVVGGVALRVSRQRQ